MFGRFVYAFFVADHPHPATPAQTISLCVIATRVLMPAPCKNKSPVSWSLPYKAWIMLVRLMGFSSTGSGQVRLELNSSDPLKDLRTQMAVMPAISSSH